MHAVRFVAILAATFVVPGGCASAATMIHLAEVNGPITPATVWYLDLALDSATDTGDSVLLVEIDTPGGLVASTEEIVQRLLASPVPVVVYVTPSGAHAASAGFYILISADVAAMAPGTRTGAASVVYGSGENDPDDILLRKQTQDAAALVRSIAERRGRNVAAAERTVLDAVAYTENEVLESGLIDLVAADRAELIQALDGREVRSFDGRTRTLDLSDAVVTPVEIDFKGQVLGWVAHPGVAYLLLIVGALGLYIEFHNPGLIVPGVVGGVCLILFAVASSVLPVTTIGVLLIVLAIVLFVLELKFVSYGSLSLAGLVALVVGSMMLIDGPIPELRVPPAVYLPTSLVTAALLVFVVFKIRRAYLDKVETGREGLVGEIGEARTSLAPKGKVFVHGEFWDATCETGSVAAGEAVRVIRVDAMRIVVTPAASPSKDANKE
jgi:membrane-bound serine protease (ClpP class)